MRSINSQFGHALSDEGCSIAVNTHDAGIVELSMVNLAVSISAPLSPGEARAIADTLIVHADHCDRHLFAKALNTPVEADAPVTDDSAAGRWDGRTLKQVTHEAMRRAAEAALSAHSGNRSAAARALGISRQHLYRIMPVGGAQ